MSDPQGHDLKALFAPVHFGSSDEPGIRRRGSTRFTYVDERTHRPPSKRNLERIRALAVPPAWSDVWITADPGSHLQACGRDARGRKQYRYHPGFTESQSENKFDDLASFGQVLGSLRSRVTRDLGKNDLSHDRVVATVVRLLDVTSLRVGNVEYARANRSFGLTTLRNRHVTVHGTVLRFTFRGKSAHDFDVVVDNARLAKIVRSCQHLPGQQLFEYTAEDGVVRAIGSSDVNTYLGEHGVPGLTAKTFRTWNATVRAAEGLADVAAVEAVPTKSVVNAVIDQVADHLGNTRSVCRNSYVHPAVLAAYLDGSLMKQWRRPVGRRPAGLLEGERRTLRILR